MALLLPQSIDNCSLIEHRPFGNPKAKPRKGHNHHKQEPCQAGSISDIQVGERILKEIHGIQQSGIHGTAFGHQIRLGKGLHAPHHVNNAIEQNDRRDSAQSASESGENSGRFVLGLLLRREMMNYPFTFWLSALNTWSIAQRLPIEHWCVRYSGQSPWRQDADWKDWTEPTARFRELETEAHVPWPNAVLLANVRGETLLKVNGGAAYGFNPYHRQYSPKVIAGTNVQLGLEQVPMGLMGSESDHPGIVSFEWALVDPVARACYWDLAVLLEWGEDPAVPSDMKRWLKDALREAFQDLYGRSPDERAIRGWLESEDRSVAAEPLARILDGGTIQGVGHHSADAHFAAALENLQRALRRIYLTLASKKESGLSAVQVLGHAHIDWAWLWPVAETRRKVVRTAATQIALLEQYPEWRFGMSSPAMWQVLEGEPELWARWKRWVSCGRIEPLGAMWLEADCQMVDSEPFLRHLIMGLRYFQDKVQKRPSIAFLPDTFGFPAALPTIFSAAKIQLFLTTKINANDTNPFPYKQFQWMGPDGSVVPAMIFGSSPEDYNGLRTSLGL